LLTQQRVADLPGPPELELVDAVFDRRRRF